MVLREGSERVVYLFSGGGWRMFANRIPEEQLMATFQSVGVGASDLVYVASFMPIFGPDPDILAKAVSALRRTVTESGTIVMPTFNWSYCESRQMDLRETPSQVGVLTEYFRRQEGVCRSRTPPWCTFASWGAMGEKIAGIRGTSAFGPDGIPQFLHDHNAKFLLLGCPYEDAVIHTHWLEEELEVPYRYWKRFVGTVKDGQTEYHDVSYMYARSLDVDTTIDIREIAAAFEATGKVALASLGLGTIRCFRIRDYTAFVRPYMLENPLALLNSAARGQYERTHGNGRQG